MADRPPELIAFGSAVRQLRHAAELTQDDVSRASGLHTTYISEIERGIRNPTWITVCRLAAALEVPVALLAERAEHAKT